MTDNTEAAPEPTQTKNEELRTFVTVKVERIQAALLGNNPKQQARARAVLAQLRRAPMSGDPVYAEAWQIILGPTGLATSSTVSTELFPERLRGHGDTPSAAELAAYTALVSYSTHQQSLASHMHVRKASFAQAVGRLVTLTSPSIKSRFDAFTTAQSRSTINSHLRSLITLLRSQQIGFDYGKFAVDLAQLYTPRERNGVLMRFSREFVNGYLAKPETPVAESQE
ncbi:type I-E CRISPR-associated protein Cse2/CasB [Leucobacter chinensis]|uniref:type I-E CRISPR-associated protein Cse2/CasB n=1 Tax=Leucobacter chinensis TaxID=2851010 RepID=UPI001C248FBC|nr:type I-E CRISPR-associated protein Cse2/CasB [Leucobacter chinensis]